MSVHITYTKQAKVAVFPISLGLRFSESYFDVCQSIGSCDVHAVLCLKDRLDGWMAEPRATRVIDLRPTPDEVFRDFSPGNRYKIERARQRDDVETNLFVAPSEPRLLAFADYYDAFAATKGIPPIQRSQFHALAEAGNLAISTVSDREAGILAAHAYVV